MAITPGTPTAAAAPAAAAAATPTVAAATATTPAAAPAAPTNSVTYDILIDASRCTGCGLCEAFCPVEVFTMRDGLPVAVAPEACWGCETCVGQCPDGALLIKAQGGGDPFAGRAQADPLPAERLATLQGWAATLKQVLGLRWEPVAVSLIPAGAPLPDVPIPAERMRYCQSLMAARRGRSIMMPANRHACPDGTSILGLTPMPAKLASGELYILFHKLHSIEAARRMVHERPCLEPRTIDATVVTPLAKAATEPQVIAIACQPEQAMWLLMSASYYTGHRHDLHASGYNAQCVETTLLPYTTGEVNVSFGCYGCRAASDVSDNLMFVGIPTALMPRIIDGLAELGQKAIPQSRAKIYL